MKKFFEKHDLFKVVAFFMLLTALLTWVIRYSVFQNGSLMTYDETVKGVQAIMDTSTIGVFDFNTYFLLVLYYFTNVFVFVLVVFAFYKALGKSKYYNAIVEKIAELFKGKETIFAGISMVFYAVLASISTDFIITLVFIPFSISVFAKLKTDKISTLASTFGGVLIGVAGATYSTKVIGNLIDTAGFSIKFGNEMSGVIVLSIISIIALLSFVVLRMNNKDKKELVEDNFISVEETKKKKRLNIVPTVIALIVTAVVIILAFMPWSVWNVNTFTDAFTKLTEATLFGATYPIIFIGSSTLVAFGSWDLFTVSSFLILALFVIKFIANIKLDELIEGVGEGLKLAIKPVVLLMMVYAVLVFSVSYPVLPSIINAINNALSADILRPLNWLVGGFVTSVFTVDFQYTASIVGGLYSTFENGSVVAVALQTAYALAGFVAPTSAMLMLGLSTLDIKLKDYYKFIWKFLVILLVVTLIVLYILLYV